MNLIKQYELKVSNIDAYYDKIEEIWSNSYIVHFHLPVLNFYDNLRWNFNVYSAKQKQNNT